MYLLPTSMAMKQTITLMPDPDFCFIPTLVMAAINPTKRKNRPNEFSIRCSL